MITSHTPDPAPAADMDPQTRAQLLRAARGIVRPAAAGEVPMGIRYRTPAETARPVPADRRPLWMTMAPTGVLEEIADTAPRPALQTARAEAPRPARTAAGTPPRATAPPAATGTTRTRAATPATRTAATTAAPAPRAAAAPAAEAAQPRVLARYDSWHCEVCGSRYATNSGAHDCGPLIAVTVTIATKIAGGRA